MSRNNELFTNFLSAKFKNAKFISGHKEYDKINTLYVAIVAVEKDGDLPSPSLGNFDLAYTLFYINKFEEFKFAGLNIIDLIESSEHQEFWQIRYKY